MKISIWINRSVDSSVQWQQFKRISYCSPRINDIEKGLENTFIFDGYFRVQMGFLWKLWTRFVLYIYYHYLQHTQLKNCSVEKFAQEKGRIWNDPKEEDEIRIMAPKLYWNYIETDKSTHNDWPVLPLQASTYRVSNGKMFF